MILALLIVWAVGAILWGKFLEWGVRTHPTEELDVIVAAHPVATNVVIVLSSLLWPLSFAYNLVYMVWGAYRA